MAAVLATALAKGRKTKEQRVPKFEEVRAGWRKGRKTKRRYKK
jgi:hypothetical protein